MNIAIREKLERTQDLTCVLSIAKWFWREKIDNKLWPLASSCFNLILLYYCYRRCVVTVNFSFP